MKALLVIYTLALGFQAQASQTQSVVGSVGHNPSCETGFEIMAPDLRTCLVWSDAMSTPKKANERAMAVTSGAVQFFGEQTDSGFVVIGVHELK